MIRVLARLFESRSGVAAAEMALMTPLLLALMTATFEMGNYMWNEHTVVKAVRDGARFAARQPFGTFPTCPGPTSLTGTTAGTVQGDTRAIIRTAQVAAGGEPRLPNWTNAATNSDFGISVVYTCDSTTTAGIYNGMTGGARIVTVTATVPYTSLFTQIGFNTTALSLSATSKAAVTGI